MKKLVVLFSIILLNITLVSCGSPPTLKNDFSATFTAQYEDNDCAGTLNKNGDHLTVTITEPYTVAGMVFDYSDVQLSIKSQGHSTNADADYLPDNSVPGALRNALLYLSQASYTGSEKGEDSYTVTTPYGEAALIASDGYLTKITEPHSGIIFHFTQASDPIEE